MMMLLFFVVASSTIVCHDLTHEFDAFGRKQDWVRILQSLEQTRYAIKADGKKVFVFVYPGVCILTEPYPDLKVIKTMLIA